MCLTSVKPLVGLHLSVGFQFVLSRITQGLLRLLHHWGEAGLGLLKETQKLTFVERH